MTEQITDSSSAVVKIELRVKGQKDGDAIIKGTTSKGIDILEANGAIFYRKRKPSQPVDVQTHRRRESLPMCTADQPNTNAVKEATTLTESSRDNPIAEEDPGKCLDQRKLVTSDPSHLLCMQLESCLPKSCPSSVVVQFALDQLLVNGASKLDKENNSAVYSLAAKSLLRAFSTVLTEQSDTAKDLLQQISRSTVKRQEAGNSYSASHCSPFKAVIDAMPQYLALPPMVREQSQDSSLRSRLQQQLDVLLEEESAWISLKSKCPWSSDTMHDVAPAAENKERVEETHRIEEMQVVGTKESSALNQVVENGEESGEEQYATGLQEVEESVSSTLMLQVESLTSFLSKADSLVAKGEQACMLLQADYHQEKFKTFPHVNSPAWLIKHIVSEQPTDVEK
ncbi:hypothetical protein CEUSTIGMA_g10030.t1 [Chlamydomonas eustigma]|uniref:Uncharacterized protein n=1 Tax=Chlamydomonas eustigma TaxID=1157962 RepID=A0A250XHQ3_9CHLO|nr:hypothetical protein CEUSTIGMA_g10030.t1 [Chlamydomonas eustigma]|eukprot:GAX82604.1 hypothetical protein CEUSTIGMA_g10030.t1 [Chlamydomonas eustigma]